MASAFDLGTMAEALDRLARAATDAGVKLDVAIYGGSALMLASTFRYASEDVDVRLIGETWPSWLTEAVARIGDELSIARDWFNDHVLFHLSETASDDANHLLLGTFPRDQSEIGLRVFVPTAEYMLALKLKAMRVLDPVKGDQEGSDILNLMHIVGCATPEDALAVMAKFFPRSAAAVDAPQYPVRRL